MYPFLLLNHNVSETSQLWCFLSNCQVPSGVDWKDWSAAWCQTNTQGAPEKMTCILSIYDNLPRYFKVHPQHKHGTPKNAGLDNFMLLLKAESLSFGISSPTFFSAMSTLTGKVFIPILGAKGGRMVTFHEPLLAKTTDLGGGFKHFYVHPYLGKWSNLTI